MQSINKELNFWKKIWVSGLVMLPSYLMVAVISSNIQGWWWLVSVAIGLWIVGNIYIKVVLEKKFRKGGKCLVLQGSFFFFKSH